MSKKIKQNNKKGMKSFWEKAKILKDKRGNKIAMRISKTFRPEDL